MSNHSVTEQIVGWREHQDAVIASYVEAWLRASKRSKAQLKYRVEFSDEGVPERIVREGETVAEIHPVSTSFLTVDWVRSVDDFKELDRISRRLEDK